MKAVLWFETDDGKVLVGPARAPVGADVYDALADIGRLAAPLYQDAVQVVQGRVPERCYGADSYGSHHFVPRRDGSVGGEPSFVQVCRYCGITPTGRKVG